jgi:hypothetical protein
MACTSLADVPEGNIALPAGAGKAMARMARGRIELPTP